MSSSIYSLVKVTSCIATSEGRRTLIRIRVILDAINQTWSRNPNMYIRQQTKDGVERPCDVLGTIYSVLAPGHTLIRLWSTKFERDSHWWNLSSRRYTELYILIYNVAYSSTQTDRMVLSRSWTFWPSPHQYQNLIPRCVFLRFL